MGVNNPIPLVGDKLEIDGIGFQVTVTRIVSTELSDGNGDIVRTIHIAGSSRAQTALLPNAWISSLGRIYNIVESTETVLEEDIYTDGGTWTIIPLPKELVGASVRRYFQGHGWYDGEIISQSRNAVTGEVLTSITYGEDDDAEDVDAEQLEEGISNYKMDPQPCGPLLPVHHSPLPKDRTQPLSPYSPQLLRNLDASSASSSGGSTKPTESPTQPVINLQKAAAVEVAAPTSPVTSPVAAKVAPNNPEVQVEQVGETVLALLSSLAMGKCVLLALAVHGGENEVTCTRISEGGRLGVHVSNRSSNGHVHFDDAADSLLILANVECFRIISAVQEETKQTAAAVVNDVLVVFEGPGRNDGIGRIVTTANNRGLGLDNPFDGVRSFEIIKGESGKQNKNRTISVENQGAWVSVFGVHAETSFNATTSFPGTAPINLALQIIVAELAVDKGKQLNPNSLMRGNIYNYAHGEGIFMFVSGLVRDGALTDFFGGTRVVGVLVGPPGSTFRNGTNESDVIVVNKNSIRNKTPVSDSDAAGILRLANPAKDLADVWNRCESKFSSWVSEPLLSNEIVRNVSRSSGPEGEPYITEVPQVDIAEVFKEPTAQKRRSTTSVATASLKQKQTKASSKLDAIANSVEPWNVEDEELYEPGPEQTFTGPISHHRKRPADGASSKAVSASEKSPGTLRENAARFEMQAQMQGVMLASSEQTIERQRADHANLLEYSRKASYDLLSFQDRASERQAEFYERQDSRAAFGRFEEPSQIQGQMFQEYLASGRRSEGTQREISQRQEKRPSTHALNSGPAAPNRLAIEHGSASFYSCFAFKIHT